jgi:hypothetical protein
MKRAGMWDNTVFMLTADNVSSVHIPVKYDLHFWLRPPSHPPN